MLWRTVCFFKQKTAYELRISDWSSDVGSSDLPASCSTAAMSAVPSCRRVAGNSVEWGTSRLETGKTTERWQDKRGSPVVIQAIEMACLSACLSVGSRAAIEEFSINFNGVSGTVGRRLRLAARP